MILILIFQSNIKYWSQLILKIWLMKDNQSKECQESRKMVQYSIFKRSKWKIWNCKKQTSKTPKAYKAKNDISKIVIKKTFQLKNKKRKLCFLRLPNQQCKIIWGQVIQFQIYHIVEIFTITLWNYCKNKLR